MTTAKITSRRPRPRMLPVLSRAPPSTLLSPLVATDTLPQLLSPPSTSPPSKLEKLTFRKRNQSSSPV